MSGAGVKKDELPLKNSGGLFEETVPEARMPLAEHLSELRKRILVALASFLTAFGLSFAFSERIFNLLLFPLRGYLKLGGAYPYIHLVEREKSFSLVFLSPTEAFWAHIKISIIAGLILSVPVILYELWKFLSPGLLEKERKYVTPFVMAGSGLFVIGALFCFLVVLPFAIQFLLTYKTASLVPMLSVGNYMDFCLKFILAFGAIFELPVAIVLLTRMGLVTPQTLARKRKYAVLLSFVAAAMLTPTPDAFNQVLMAIPIILLYEVGVLVSRLFIKKRGRADV